MILQHHGMSSGEGFALEFKDNISPLAKIIIISEDFVNQVLQQNERKEKKDIQKILENLDIRFSRSSYKKILWSLKNLKL